MSEPDAGRARAGDVCSVAAVVLTFNEEANIQACLSSVAGWCAELHVVDSGSTDRTIEIARAFTELIHHHAFVDYGSQWRWALEELAISPEWVLLLDADNVVTDALKQDIARTLSTGVSDVDAYYVRHAYYFRGRRMRGFKPYQLRLVRRERVRVDRTELVDVRFVPEGQVRYLAGAMIEHNLKEDDIDFWIDKHQRFAARVAAEELLRGSGVTRWSFRPRPRGTYDERIAWLKDRWLRLPLFVRPFVYFFYRFVLRAGFLDGREGLVYHFMQALWFRLLVDVKIWDLRGRLGRGELTLDDLALSVGRVPTPDQTSGPPHR